jgi:hypothetical protein
MGLNNGSQYNQWAGTNPLNNGGNTMPCLSGSNHSPRMRVLWDYGQAGDSTHTPQPSGCESTYCFVAVGRAFTPTTDGSAGTSLDSWEVPISSWAGGAGSFDDWAAHSGDSWPHLEGACASTSGTGTPASNASPDNRRWELYGYSPNEEGRNQRGVNLKAWEGGQGPSDCKRLYARLGPAGDKWGAFSAYSFGGGWENWTTPS